jgi:hypothetical protein
VKAPFYSGIESILDNLEPRDLTPSRPGCDQSAAVQSTFRGAPSASPPVDETMGRKQYVGPIEHLRGKVALVEPRGGAVGQVMAQFEEPHLQEARGWWQFCETDFERFGSPRNG